MKPIYTWLLALSAITMVACDSGEDDPVEAGTETPGGMTPAGMTPEGGMMPDGGADGGADGGTDGGAEGGVEPDPAGVEPDPAGVEPDPAGVMTGPVCTEALDVGASCDVFNPCCVRGTECVDLSGDGSDPVCLRRCDANADITGCEERELCNPENGEVPPGEESPGICYPGDNCVPGDENLACGEGEYSCQRVENITLCIGDLAEVRAQAPELIVGVGEACNPFDNMAPAYCEPGTVCEYGICRALCETSEECGESAECADFTERVDGIPYKFCLDSCDIYTQDCPEEGDVCILADSYDGAIIGVCEGGAGPNGTAVSGEECTSSETTYWGSCEASNLCTSLSEEDPDVCVSFCDDYHLDVCGEYQACAFVMALDDLGLCLGECNLFTQEGCDEGEDCTIFNEGINANDEPVTFGACSPNAVPLEERVMTGDTCEGEPIDIDGMMRENPFVSNCPPNHYCGDTGSGISTCVAACNPLNVEDTGCQDGLACRAVFEGIDSFGLCL